MTNSFVMMALGEFRFSIATAAYKELERTTEYRWPALERIGTAPARQFTGPGEDTITLSGTIYPHFRPQQAGLEQLPRMRQAASRGQPLLMVDGNGRLWGRYVVMAVRERQSTFFSNGLPRCIEFDISLAAYGGSEMSTAARAAVSNAADPDPVTATPDPDPVVPGQEGDG